MQIIWEKLAIRAQGRDRFVPGTNIRSTTFKARENHIGKHAQNHNYGSYEITIMYLLRVWVI